MSALNQLRVATLSRGMVRLMNSPLTKQTYNRRALSNLALRTFATVPSRSEQHQPAPSEITSRSPFVSPNFFREFEELSSGFYDFFDRPFMLGSPRRRLLSDIPSTLRPFSPWYEITEDGTQFQLAVDVPGVKAGDMKIHLEQDGRVLRITGERRVQEGSMKLESNFEKAFVLDKKIDTDKITANLSDGVVVITAPKKAAELKNVVEIPVTENARAPISEGEEAEDEINVSTGKEM